MTIQQVLDQLLILNRLKSMVRTGWVESKIVNPESIADHSFNVALLAFLLIDDKQADRTKILKMALVHDLAEAITGDIVWQRGNEIDIDAKHRKDEAEINAIEQIMEAIRDLDIEKNMKEVKDLFFEYMDQQTLEARLVKELDKLEMCIQALDYYMDFPFEEIWSFMESARNYIWTEKGRMLLIEIERRIKELEQ